MNIPTWVTVVGIFMILSGGCGGLNNVKKIKTPQTLEASAEMMEEVTKKMEEVGQKQRNTKKDTMTNSHVDTSLDTSDILTEEFDMDSSEVAMFESIFGNIGDMMNFSDYYKLWIVRLGIIGAIISAIYALAGIFLLMGKRYSIKLAYIAMALSLLFMIFQIVIMSMDKEGGMISKMSVNVGSYIMILINVILLIVVLASDTSYLYEHEIINE